MYHYEWTPQARRQVKKLSPEVQRVIIKKLDYFLTITNPLSFAKRLTHYGAGQYRFRIGDWRIVFDVAEDTIIVLDVGHRSEIYK